ncbi:MAG: UDP-3-O-(3-hydroxymyristoyl)glucosamine N-acyltransferase [Pseudomonadota bacterium]
MAVDLTFHRPKVGLTFGAFAAEGGVQLPDGLEPETEFKSFCSLSEAADRCIAFAEKVRPGSLPDSIQSLAAIICKPDHTELIASNGAVPVPVEDPRAAFQDAVHGLFPDSLGNAQTIADSSVSDFLTMPNGAIVSKSAELEEGVELGAGAIIGDDVWIGRGTRIGDHVTVARQCRVGRNCDIGAGSSIQYALIGDRVVFAPGVQIGQEGFGFVPRASGLKKMPQLGRVIIQDDVEIGSNTAVDRGTLSDTSIGQGTKIDNLVQVGHNVTIGASTVIAAHSGLSGSCKIGNFCMLGGRVGVADHVKVGDGARIAATSGVMHDVPAGEQWAGAPAQPSLQFFKQLAALRKLAFPVKK